MLIDLADAGDAAVSGGKAAPLARLIRAGFPVPPGFVVPVRTYQQAVAGLDLARAARRGENAGALVVARNELPSRLVAELSHALTRVADLSGDGFFAVRSSAIGEDGAVTAAGQHDSFLGVRGPDQVADAVRRCWASLWSQRAVRYRQLVDADRELGSPSAAVLVQRLIDAEVAGVLFTGADTRIEASWGLGVSVVGGDVTPDSWLVSDGAVADRRLGVKGMRTDLTHGRVSTRAVARSDRNRLCLTDEIVLSLARLGREIEGLFGESRDIEWAIADDKIWILQARPITAPLPTNRSGRSDGVTGHRYLNGIPASAGLVTGTVRVVRGPGDFVKVKPGDVLVCRTTEPAWTPLFGVVAAVITEIGGLLSHAAIVAREQALPAVLAVPDATASLTDGVVVHVDGDTGRVMIID